MKTKTRRHYPLKWPVVIGANVLLIVVSVANLVFWWQATALVLPLCFLSMVLSLYNVHAFRERRSRIPDHRRIRALETELFPDPDDVRKPNPFAGDPRLREVLESTKPPKGIDSIYKR